jgi:hypothetical protein
LLHFLCTHLTGQGFRFREQGDLPFQLTHSGEELRIGTATAA